MNTAQRNYLTSGDLAQLTGISRKTIHAWEKQGILRPERDGSGTGYPGRHSFRDSLAICVGVNLKGRGFSVPQAGGVINWIMARSLESVMAEWAMGRVLLVVVGDKIHPRLLTHEAVYENPAIDMPAIFACGLPVAVIDMQLAYRKMMERVAELRRQEEQSESTGKVPSAETVAT